MNNILKLIKLSWNLKRSMWRCYKLGKDTEEYRLAKYYQNSLDNLKNNEEAIEALRLETQVLQEKHYDSKEMKSLLAAVMCFLGHTELVRE